MPLPSVAICCRVQCGRALRNSTVVFLLQETILSIFTTSEILNPLLLKIKTLPRSRITELRKINTVNILNQLPKAD